MICCRLSWVKIALSSREIRTGLKQHECEAPIHIKKAVHKQEGLAVAHVLYKKASAHINYWRPHRYETTDHWKLLKWFGECGYIDLTLPPQKDHSKSTGPPQLRPSPVTAPSELSIWHRFVHYGFSPVILYHTKLTINEKMNYLILCLLSKLTTYSTVIRCAHYSLDKGW